MAGDSTGGGVHWDEVAVLYILLDAVTLVLLRMLFEEGIQSQSLSVDGWLTKEVKEGNNIEEFDKDSMKDGVQSRERHNLSMDILFRKLQVSQAQT